MVKKFIYVCLEDYRLIMERRYVRPNDPESYAGGNEARQVKG
jgi:hypothetical protein